MKALLTCLLAFCGLNVAAAAPIHYIYEGTASGSLDGTRFENTAFWIVAEADTANRTSISIGYNLPVDSGTFTLTGLGDFDFTNPQSITLDTRVNNVYFAPGAVRAAVGSPSDIAIATWDFVSSLGPISGTGGIVVETGFSIQTSGGPLVFDNSNTVPMTFRAVVVPEPSTILLSIFGVAALSGFRRMMR
jgi:hypothetical protein